MSDPLSDAKGGGNILSKFSGVTEHIKSYLKGSSSNAIQGSASGGAPAASVNSVSLASPAPARAVHLLNADSDSYSFTDSSSSAESDNSESEGEFRVDHSDLLFSPLEDTNPDSVDFFATQNGSSSPIGFLGAAEVGASAYDDLSGDWHVPSTPSPSPPPPPLSHTPPAAAPEPKRVKRSKKKQTTSVPSSPALSPQGVDSSQLSTGRWAGQLISGIKWLATSEGSERKDTDATATQRFMANLRFSSYPASWSEPVAAPYTTSPVPAAVPVALPTVPLHVPDVYQPGKPVYSNKWASNMAVQTPELTDVPMHPALHRLAVTPPTNAPPSPAYVHQLKDLVSSYFNPSTADVSRLGQMKSVIALEKLRAQASNISHAIGNFLNAARSCDAAQTVEPMPVQAVQPVLPTVQSAVPVPVLAAASLPTCMTIPAGSNSIPAIVMPPSPGIPFSPVGRAGWMEDDFKGGGSSCHQCKTRFAPSMLVHCATSQSEQGRRRRKRKRDCRKKYCQKCLARFYNEQAVCTPPDWMCPGCRNTCSCAECRRKRGEVGTAPAVADHTVYGCSDASTGAGHAPTHVSVVAPQYVTYGPGVNGMGLAGMNNPMMIPQHMQHMHVQQMHMQHMMQFAQMPTAAPALL